MKIRIQNLMVALAMLALSTLNSQLSTARAQGTAFTYQAQLTYEGSPANGTYNMNFTLFDNMNATGPSYPLADGPITGVTVNNGLFSVVLDFGSDVFGPTVFAGNIAMPFWVQIQVETNGATSYTTLTPLQELTPAPYSIYAETSGASSNLLGTLPVGQLSGMVANSQLADSSITVAAGAGLSGGGLVNLGGSTTLANTGVISVVSGTPDITVSPATGTGAVTLNDTATSANTPSTIVKRDSSGNFFAETVRLSGFLDLPAPAFIYASGVPALSITSTSENTSLGFETPQDSGTGNTAIGWQALVINTGQDNTAVGSAVLVTNSSGDSDTGLGYRALTSLGNGNNNTAVGTVALSALSGGSENTAVGEFALGLSTGNNNTALGCHANFNMEL